MTKRRHVIREMEVKMTRKDGKNTESIGRLTIDDFELKVERSIAAAINEDLDALQRNIGDENIRQISSKKIKHDIHESIVLSTNEVVVPHNLGVIPLYYIVTPKTSGTWWESKKPDKTAVYLIAGAAMTVDVIIKG